MNKRKYLKGFLLVSFLCLLLSGCSSFDKKEHVEQNLETKNVVEQVIKFEKNVIQNTKYGTVKGVEENNGKTLVWRGIPYAKSPEGELRWKAPVNPEPWTDILDASKSGNTAIQFNWGKISGTEDCLNLDIYRPNTDETNLPIFFYIHGGNNQTGISEEIKAQKFAVNANVIVVSINYRVGLFGFNNLPSLKTGDKYEDSGNYTLLDIAKSLDWVKENISNFGGDPANITATGFSAGGRDLMAMLISPIFKGKFQKAISFSGGMTIANYSESQELFAKALAPLVVKDGMAGNEEEAFTWLMTPDEEVKNYLYGIAPERLAVLMGNAGIRMEVFPHLFNDGVVIPKDGFSTKEYNDVPLVMITGSSEFSLFARFDKEFARFKEEELIDGSELAKRYAFVYKYGSRLYGLFNTQESAERMFNNYKAPIYTVDFDFGTNKNIFSKRTTDVFGALHGIWIPFLMSEIQGASGLIAKDIAPKRGTWVLAGVFTQYISNFMKEGNPNIDGLVKWEPWESASNGPSNLILDADADKPIIKMSYERESYEQILLDMKNDTTISEDAKQYLIEKVLNGRWFSKELDQHFENSNPWVQVY